MIRHTVRDFNEWKPGYDSHLPVREAAGLTESQLLRGSDNPNEVVILLKVADLAKAKTFIGSPDLKNVMQEFGVTGVPEITILFDENAKGSTA